MEAAPDVSPAVPEVLDLLTNLTVLAAVTLHHQRAEGTAHITVRRIVRRPRRRTRHQYWWETRVTTGEQAWHDTGIRAYATAEAAYQAAVQAVQAVQAASGHRIDEATAGAP